MGLGGAADGDGEQPHHREKATYWERVHRIFEMLDFRLAFITAEEAQSALDALRELNQQSGEDDDATQEERGRLERIRNAAIHPQTNQVIWTPLRLSMVVPVNMMLDGLMLLAKTPFQTVGAQWLNQSYNAFHYYANRNTTNEESMSQRLMAYVGATVGSVGVAIYLKKVPRLSKFAPFCAVAAADVMNLSIMRKAEFLEGIHVYDVDSETLAGTSKRAGLMATGSCIFARVAAAFPILAGTPLVMEQIERRTRVFHRLPAARFPATLAIVGCMIQVAVPFTFGVFRQEMVVGVDWLEPEFREKDGLRKVYFNKGL